MQEPAFLLYCMYHHPNECWCQIGTKLCRCRSRLPRAQVFAAQGRDYFGKLLECECCCRKYNYLRQKEVVTVISRWNVIITAEPVCQADYC